MSAQSLAPLKSCEGRWAGTNRLWVDPEKPVRESPATATVVSAGQGRFVTIAYTWMDEGKPQDGLIVIGYEKDREAATAYWLDSWHMGVKVMTMAGAIEGDGAVFVRGTYPAPPGPDWGWSIRIAPADGQLRIVMHNIWPEGREDLAVEAVLVREDPLKQAGTPAVSVEDAHQGATDEAVGDRRGPGPGYDTEPRK